MGSNISRQLKTKANDFTKLSLALDELIDVTYTAQLWLFTYRVNDNFELNEELSCMNSFHCTNDRKEYFQRYEKKVILCKLKWNLL